jgi:hypothetical protein
MRISSIRRVVPRAGATKEHNMTRAYVTVIALTALAVGVAAACGDEPEQQDQTAGNDYTLCTDMPQNNPILVCDSMKAAVESLCGFSLTVDHCDCYDEVSPCAVSSEGISDVVMTWLQGIIDCESSADCTAYMTCLEALGEVESCTNPLDWSCITTVGSEGETDG